MAMKWTKRLFIISLPTIIVGLAAILLMNWRLPTTVILVALVERVVFTVGGNHDLQLTNPTMLRSVTLDHFSKIGFCPEKMEVADPTQYDLKEGRFPDTAWQTLDARDQQVTFSGGDIAEQYSAAVESIGGLKLGVILITPDARVTLAARVAQGKNGEEHPNLTIELENQESRAILTPSQSFQVTGNRTRLQGVQSVLHEDRSLTYRVWLRNGDPEIEIVSRSDPPSLYMSLRIVAEQKTYDTLAITKIPISSVEFEKQDSTGERKSSLLEPVSVRYPSYPKVTPDDISEVDFLRVESLQDFFIEKMSLVPEKFGINIRLKGVAGYAKAGQKDLRLTLMEMLWHNWNLSVLALIVFWMASTSYGFIKFIKTTREESV